MKTSSGFSLAELLMVVALFSVLACGIVLTLFSAQRSWTVGSGETVLTLELRRGLDQISRELTESQPAQVQQPAANGQWGNTIVFRVPRDRDGDGSVLDANGTISEWSNLITYQFQPGGRANNCTRTEVNDPGLQPRSIVSTVANHVTDVRFRRQAAAADVVEIQMTASTINEMGQVFSRNMATRVKLRN
ncbi:MAG: prepilin-type N-terminal cleavage/methylation domain-containing protein [Candidatus Omnitrophica bacterium]|nr:prepilin-type N-terminal cleavage/methylation domain-containing protein [Candidatus Omnitrophota bacterium]